MKKSTRKIIKSLGVLALGIMIGWFAKPSSQNIVAQSSNAGEISILQSKLDAQKSSNLKLIAENNAINEEIEALKRGEDPAYFCSLRPTKKQATVKKTVKPVTVTPTPVIEEEEYEYSPEPQPQSQPQPQPPVMEEAPIVEEIPQPELCVDSSAHNAQDLGN